MIDTWMNTDMEEVWLVVASTIVIFLAVIVASRILGLRSFSKMSSYDFAATVATGSIVATVSVTSTSLATGIVGLATLFASQGVISRFRRWSSVGTVVDNEPLLLMVQGRLLHDHLRSARITEDDVRAKLREANVLRFVDAQVVVLETTGDITVLHGEGMVGPELLQDVRGSDQYVG